MFKFSKTTDYKNKYLMCKISVNVACNIFNDFSELASERMINCIYC